MKKVYPVGKAGSTNKMMPKGGMATTKRKLVVNPYAISPGAAAAMSAMERGVRKKIAKKGSVKRVARSRRLMA